MNHILDIHFHKEPACSSDFSYQRRNNSLDVWVQSYFIGSHPFTYTIEEALEDLCEMQGQLFLGIIDMLSYSLKSGNYAWKWL